MKTIIELRFIEKATVQSFGPSVAGFFEHALSRADFSLLTSCQLDMIKLDVMLSDFYIWDGVLTDDRCWKKTNAEWFLLARKLVTNLSLLKQWTPNSH